MSDTTLDPQREKLIAALYGELNEQEEQELKAHLAQDASLRADWDELHEARAFLKAEAEGPAPSFVFLTPPAGAKRVEEEPAGFWQRLRAGLQSPAGVFAAATAAAVIMVAAGFRVDRTPNGLTMGFGPSVNATPPTSLVSAERPGSMIPLETVEESGQPAAPFSLTSAQAAQQAQYLTRTEFINYTNEMMLMLTARQNSRDQRRNGEMALMLQSFYDELMQRQRLEYADLRSQIDRVGFGIAGGNSTLESLIKKGERYELTPVRQTTNQKEGGPNE